MPKNRKKRQIAGLPPKEELKDIRIVSGEGVRMAHSESFVKFAQQHRDKKRPFYLSDWLKTLSDEALEALKKDAYGLSSELRGDPDEADSTDHGRQDVLNVAVTVYMVETGQPTMTAEPEKIVSLVTSLAISASIITLVRRGLLDLHAPLSIREDQSLKLSIPQKSRDAYEAFRAGMH